MKQATSNLFLIRPFRFFGNPETSVNNYFQSNDFNAEQLSISKQALIEFDNFLNILRKNNLNVILFNDTEKPITPDSIFPNNWISTHESGDIFIHSMFAENRRQERRADIVNSLKEKFSVSNVFNDAEFNEKNKKFLVKTKKIKKVSDKFKKTKAPKTLWVRRKKAS